MQIICVLITKLFAPGIVCYRIPSQKILPFVFGGDISSLLCLHQVAKVKTGWCHIKDDGGKPMFWYYFEYLLLESRAMERIAWIPS